MAGVHRVYKRPSQESTHLAKTDPAIDQRNMAQNQGSDRDGLIFWARGKGLLLA